MSRLFSASALLMCLAVLVIGVGCSGKEGEPAKRSDTSSTETDHGAGHGVHTPPVVEVEDLAGIGRGPKVGDTWSADVGVNICGRFIDPLPGVPSDGLTPQPDGTVAIAPTVDAEAGESMTLGDFADAVGMTLSTGELTLPSETTPASIDVLGTNVVVSGATFVDGADCGGTPAEVQVWVYSADARATGEGLVTVVEDPQDVPFAEDGMAIVVAVTPESSLPTLPPSAAVGGQ